MSDLVDELELLIGESVRKTLPGDPADGLSLGDLLITYFAWRGRQVVPRGRQAHLSDELKSNPKAAEYSQALAAIVSKIEQGEDLKPHLSRSVDTLVDFSSDGPLEKQDGLDLLLGDWGIHHLHLSTEIKPNGRTRRTADLLFAVFEPEDAYLINVYPHFGSWGARALVEVLVRTWPGVGRLAPSQIAGLRLTQQYSEADGLLLRNAGVTSALEIDGKVYSPVPGLTTAGTPLEASIRSNAVLCRLDELRREGDLTEALDRLVGTPKSSWKPFAAGEDFGFSNGTHFVCSVSVRD